MTITHSFVSEKADGADTSVVRPSDWNADHVLADGYALLRVATVTLDNDQIKALPEIAAEILPAPGENKVILVFSGVCVLDIVTPYNSPAIDSVLRLVCGPTESPVSSMLVMHALGYPFGEEAHFITTIIPVGLFGATFDPDLCINNQDIVRVKNQAVKIKEVWTGGVPFTGGDASNTLKVTIYYMIIDV